MMMSGTHFCMNTGHFKKYHMTADDLPAADLFYGIVHLRFIAVFISEKKIIGVLIIGTQEYSRFNAFAECTCLRGNGTKAGWIAHTELPIGTFVTQEDVGTGGIPVTYICSLHIDPAAAFVDDPGCAIEFCAVTEV